MATCFLKQNGSTYTIKRYENFTDGLTPRQESEIEQTDQQNQQVCDFPIIPSSIYKFEPYNSETTASEFSKVTVNYPVNGYIKYINSNLNW